MHLKLISQSEEERDDLTLNEALQDLLNIVNECSTNRDFTSKNKIAEITTLFVQGEYLNQLQDLQKCKSYDISLLSTELFNILIPSIWSM